MNLPIGLTITRIVAVPLLILFLITSSRVHALIASAIFVAASITDWLDGVVARRRNQVTTLGTLLDPIADKLLVPASRLAKWKTVSQFVAVTMLILEKGLVSEPFHVAATGVLWVSLVLTVVSAVDYFYRFFRKADYRSIVPEEERWS